MEPRYTRLASPALGVGYVSSCPGLDTDQHIFNFGGIEVPKEIQVVSSLPREASGKIFKRKLRDQYGRSGNVRS